jgi:hypothetical protein
MVGQYRARSLEPYSSQAYQRREAEGVVGMAPGLADGAATP